IETGGRPTGFDYLRLALAVLIVCSHSVVMSYGVEVQTVVASAPWRPLTAVLLPAFFALSGFLVAGSLERSKTIGMFVGLRALRIYPALAVESLIAALVLGPLLTTQSFGAYFSDHELHTYFLNILGDPHYMLPGVFKTNPIQEVNGQLWTIPYELRCYVMLTALALLGAVRRPAILLGATLAYMAWGVIDTLLHYPFYATYLAGPAPAWLLLANFLCGVLLYLYRERIPWKWSWGLASLAAAMVLYDIPAGHYAAVPLLTYATVFFGLTNPPKTGVLKGADYSYGIYLYGSVIQQTFVALAPWGRHWWINIAVSVPVSALVAALSWHLVEKRALGFRTQLGAWEARWLARRAARPAAGAVRDAGIA
ncbi:MAG TPA: acyltransferase, partial [Phenylobacterium sp.]|nr:acyltransferase [Phenylobacterium sp.]